MAVPLWSVLVACWALPPMERAAAPFAWTPCEAVKQGQSGGYCWHSLPRERKGLQGRKDGQEQWIKGTRW